MTVLILNMSLIQVISNWLFARPQPARKFARVRTGPDCRPLLATALLLSGANAFAQKSDDLMAGSAKVEITPAQAQLASPTDVIRDPLFARVIVVSTGSSCAVLVGLDLANTPNDLVDRAKAQIETVTGCAKSSILISATHTHSAGTGPVGLEGAAAQALVDAMADAASQANARLRRARVGYGVTQMFLNVNRDRYTPAGEWRQQANPEGPSDKTLAVVQFVDDQDLPIAVYMNYAMHPINFYLSGVVSADFPGAASRAIEDVFDQRTVAIFSQGAAGDQNPLFMEKSGLTSIRANGRRIARTRSSSPEGAGGTGDPRKAGTVVPQDQLAAYRREIARTGTMVDAQGTLLASAAQQVMREQHLSSDGQIWSGERRLSCPGRRRLDGAAGPRENVLPPYGDSDPVSIKVGLLRIGDINLLAVDGEVYSTIGQRLKAALPEAKTVVVTLANGSANSGYIYNDDAAHHLTFQVIGSRLKPQCAESGIIDAALDLMSQSRASRR